MGVPQVAVRNPVPGGIIDSEALSVPSTVVNAPDFATTLATTNCVAEVAMRRFTVIELPS